MRLYLKTADEICQLWLGEGYFEWKSGRELSKGLLKFLQQSLSEVGRGDWLEISDIVVFRGPGSYTSLRIGITVANTLADSLNIPIVGTSGEDWRKQGDKLLETQAFPQIITPIYHQDVFITSPRK